MNQSACELNHISWQDYYQLEPHEKSPYLFKDDHLHHVLFAQQFSKSFIDDLCVLADNVRRIAKSREGLLYLQTILADKRAMLHFAQPSTRTFLSFYSACQMVGIKPAEVRDSSTSSEIKGESQEDTVRTFSSYFDIIIMRHPMGGLAERIAWVLSNTPRPVPVVNAGSGKDQHPTQALLDIYTLQRSFSKLGGISGKKIAFVGDLARGRTVRSLSQLLMLYDNVKQYFIAPESLQITDDILDLLKRNNVDFEVSNNFHEVIPEVDAIYMTRIQDEWDIEDESRSLDTSWYHFKKEHLEILKKDAIIMHPLPRRHEIDVQVDADPRAKYWQQVRNGMWIRTALLLTIFGRDHEIGLYNG